MSKYIHLAKEWPAFNCEYGKIIFPLSALRYKQGRLLGELSNLPDHVELSLSALIDESAGSAALDKKVLKVEQVRASFAQKFGLRITDEVKSSREVEGMAEVILDATQNYEQVLSEGRLLDWYTYLSQGKSEQNNKSWRNEANEPSSVVSEIKGKEHIYFVGPQASRVPDEIQKFLQWFNKTSTMDPVMKAAIAHLWFVTIRPFPDCNGRIARAITEMQLARADGSRYRFYSMSAQMQENRDGYYEILEETQRGDLDITPWLLWFINCLDNAISSARENLSEIIQKAKSREQNVVTLNDRQRKILNLMKAEGANKQIKLTSSYWSSVAECSPDSALRDIQDLIDKGILEKELKGGRSTSYRLK